jgi:hypothetical protein
MKKIILVLVGSFCFAAMTVQAQTPTQQTPTQRDTTNQSQSYRQDMVVIQSGEVPSSLRTTLGDTKYKGWESGTIYRSKNNDGYVLEIRDANNNNKVTTYRFDAQGKAIPDRQ